MVCTVGGTIKRYIGTREMENRKDLRSQKWMSQKRKDARTMYIDILGHI